MAPRTTREALIAEMLGDIDALLARCDAFAAKVDALQVQMASSTAELDSAGQRYRETIVTFTEQAKHQLSSYLERKAGEASTTVMDSQQIELRKAVLDALESAANDTTGKCPPTWIRLAEHIVMSILAGVSGAIMFYWLVH